MRRFLLYALFCFAAVTSLASASSAAAQVAAVSPLTPVTLTIYERARVDALSWFSATPNAEQYGYAEQLFRFGLKQRRPHFDWQVEAGQSAVLGLPDDAVSKIAAQGQLGFGATYYASNGNAQNAAALSLRQAFLRLHNSSDRETLRIGRFEFFDGMETQPKNATLQWLQANRIAQRLVGNFAFTTGQRSFDGVDGKLRGTSWDLTAAAARATQGVYNMNANPELNVDMQYLAYTRYLAHQHLQVRGFALGYHDGRTFVVKTDNRTLAVRQADHRNIRIGSYGANAAAAIPIARGTMDLLAWGVLQDGQWGQLNHRAGAIVGEAGYRADTFWSKPWLRGGFLRATGDQNPTDHEHNTFFQVLPTPRVYARLPFFNMMNSSEQFVQLLDSPASKLDLRADMHFLHLTSARDLWYQGGGAFDNNVFGYTGRPANNHHSFAGVADISADYAFDKQLTLTAYYGDALGRSVVRSIYPQTRNAEYGYFELVYRTDHPLHAGGRP